MRNISIRTQILTLLFAFALALAAAIAAEACCGCGGCSAVTCSECSAVSCSVGPQCGGSGCTCIGLVCSKYPQYPCGGTTSCASGGCGAGHNCSCGTTCRSSGCPAGGTQECHCLADRTGNIYDPATKTGGIHCGGLNPNYPCQCGFYVSCSGFPTADCSCGTKTWMGYTIYCTAVSASATTYDVAGCNSAACRNASHSADCGGQGDCDCNCQAQGCTPQFWVGGTEYQCGYDQPPPDHQCRGAPGHVCCKGCNHSGHLAFGCKQGGGYNCVTHCTGTSDSVCTTSYMCDCGLFQPCIGLCKRCSSLPTTERCPGNTTCQNWEL